ncbi:hypothetical protein Anapl_02336 [Anas platyrhynchos]|uniref:Uncharacterized protein n=1 Tax=Anas platyrhynchos TaxID=8839 RepID=R0LLA5_ANAPL|nr:hypothetical protein Anapl_02336 [Anas platyrhynchos]
MSFIHFRPGRQALCRLLSVGAQLRVTGRVQGPPSQKLQGSRLILSDVQEKRRAYLILPSVGTPDVYPNVHLGLPAVMLVLHDLRGTSTLSNTAQTPQEKHRRKKSGIKPRSPDHPEPTKDSVGSPSSSREVCRRVASCHSGSALGHGDTARQRPTASRILAHMRKASRSSRCGCSALGWGSEHRSPDSGAAVRTYQNCHLPPRRGEEHLHTGSVPSKIICTSAGHRKVGRAEHQRQRAWDASERGLSIPSLDAPRGLGALVSRRAPGGAQAPQATQQGRGPQPSAQGGGEHRERRRATPGEQENSERTDE